LEFTPLYRIRVEALDEDFRYSGYLHASRVPSAEEVALAFADQAERNDATCPIPGFTQAMIETIERLGIPAVPSGDLVERSASVADARGSVCVTLGEMVVLPD
jgi:hypothetical protein